MTGSPQRSTAVSRSSLGAARSIPTVGIGRCRRIEFRCRQHQPAPPQRADRGVAAGSLPAVLDPGIDRQWRQRRPLGAPLDLRTALLGCHGGDLAVHVGVDHVRRQARMNVRRRRNRRLELLIGDLLAIRQGLVPHPRQQHVDRQQTGFRCRRYARAPVFCPRAIYLASKLGDRSLWLVSHLRQGVGDPKPPKQTYKPHQRRAPRALVTLDRMVGVVAGPRGTIRIIGRENGREVRIDVPVSSVPGLVAGLRCEWGKRR